MSTFLDLVKLVVGALLGYWLGQRGADRQYRRQQVRQRVDEARKVYVECRTQALRLTGALHRGAPGDGLGNEDRARVGEMQRRLFDARVALDVHGATVVTIALERVALESFDLLNWTPMPMPGMSQAGQAEERDFRAYAEAWAQMHSHLDDSQQAWEQWQADQEAVGGRWAWLRQVRSWPVWQRFRRRQPDKAALPPDSDVS